MLSTEENIQIKQAIEAAELHTSGEIRVFMDIAIEGEVLDRAAEVFKELEMHKTAERNGVLIYLSMESKKFAIIGDAGINTKVPLNFWEEIKTEMQASFKEGKFAQGLLRAIDAAGKALGTYFPRSENDVDELPNDVVYR